MYRSEPQVTASSIVRWAVRVLAVLGLIWALLFGIFCCAYWRLGARVDQDGGPPPTWLPAAATDLHLRGTGLILSFSGHVPQSAIETWATKRGLPLKERRRGAVIVIDYGKVPSDRTNDSFRHDESLQSHLEDAEEIVWERRDTDGGGIIVHYIPSLQVFYGDRAAW